MIEPILLKAGDARLKINGQPPLVDCRVIAEENYQDLIEKANRLEAVVSQKNADFTASELMIIMNEIIEQHPAQGNYAEDGRCTYPERWNVLLKYIKEKQ